MIGNPLFVLVWLVVLVVPVGVAVMAGRRLLLSRSFHAVAYAQVCAFAAAAAAGTAFFIADARPVDAGGVVLALLSLPLWLVVRHLCGALPRSQDEVTFVPVFTTRRRPLVLRPADRR